MSPSVWTAAATLAFMTALGGLQAPSAADPARTLRVPGRASSNAAVATGAGLVAVAWGATAADGTTDVFAAVSDDAGATFSAPVKVNRVNGEARVGAERPPRIAVAAGPRGNPIVTVVWAAGGTVNTIKLARSNDRGRTFEPPVELQRAGAPGNRGWASLAVDEGGVAHVAWLDHRAAAEAAGHAGAGSTAHQHGAAPAAPGDGVAMAQRSSLYYAGPGAHDEREITRGVCYCCKTAIVAAGGRIALAWRHVYPGNLRDIAFSESRDGGRTFSAPVRVSQDGWSIEGCPENGPSLAAAGGLVHILWPTVVGGSDPAGALFYASTRDGRTFTPRRRLPAGAKDPAHVQLVAASTGVLVAAWDEASGDRRLVRVRRLNPGAPDLAVTPVATLGGEEGARHPALALMPAGGVAVAWSAGSGGQEAVKVQVLR